MTTKSGPHVLITTVPFANRDRLPLDLLEGSGANYVINPLGRRLKEHELAEMVGEIDVMIAGTEPITAAVMSRAPRLKLISRVGVGLDNVDLLEAEARGIHVSYTPDAPGPAVAELTVGLILSLLRAIHVANAQLHRGEWQRHFGRRVSEVTVGIIGAGRIGSGVITRLSALGEPRILVSDIAPPGRLSPGGNIEWVEKEELYARADVISVHVPLTAQTVNMIRREQLLAMKPDAVVINTARGGIINEQDLADVLSGGHLAGAGIDVFEQEPYSGPLAAIDRCVLTSHMGSMSIDCRTRMEIEATEEAVRFLTRQPLAHLVPAEEYDLRRAASRTSAAT